ncbi:hypothetical protein LMG23992_00186 [Cupriavidus laharis]|uniref:Uncharacterized protein n=1 Tax=Cupriavidus laharis TaxID=151654 RepID=A0ABN7XZC1_9BURK|nr:hypothetical protein LMG23992_00186 [Cupriavidus laharis]
MRIGCESQVFGCVETLHFCYCQRGGANSGVTEWQCKQHSYSFSCGQGGIFAMDVHPKEGMHSSKRSGATTPVLHAIGVLKMVSLPLQGVEAITRRGRIDYGVIPKPYRWWGASVRLGRADTWRDDRPSHEACHERPIQFSSLRMGGDRNCTVVGITCQMVASVKLGRYWRGADPECGTVATVCAERHPTDFVGADENDSYCLHRTSKQFQG